MSGNEVAKPAASTAVQKRKEQVDTVRSLLERCGPQIAAALPKHMTAERLTRVAMTALQRTPALLECDPKTLALAVMNAAELGLEPNLIGHAYLVPFNNSKTGRKEVQMMPGYKGLLDLARRSGDISTIYAEVVRDGDEFHVELGTSPSIHHKPAFNTKPVTHAYAVALLKDGGSQFTVMSHEQVEAIRAKSKAKSAGPWVSDWDEMAKKTVLRRLCKTLPCSIELQKAVALDEHAEAGITQTTDLPVDLGEAEVIDPEPSVEQKVLDSATGKTEKELL